jgi:hypothetical protein
MLILPSKRHVSRRYPRSALTRLRQGRPVLHLALAQPQAFRDRAVPALVAAGADVDARGRGGARPRGEGGAKLADLRAEPGVGQSVLSRRGGPGRSSRPTTPLMLAAELAAPHLMRTLIEAKADQAVLDQGGRTALDLLLEAVRLDGGDLAHALRVSCADVNARNEVRPGDVCDAVPLRPCPRFFSG